MARRRRRSSTRNKPATVILRGYKQGQYLSPYMSSPEVEERLSFNGQWGATLFGGAVGYSQGIEDNRGVYLKLGYAW